MAFQTLQQHLTGTTITIMISITIMMVIHHVTSCPSACVFPFINIWCLLVDFSFFPPHFPGQQFAWLCIHYASNPTISLPNIMPLCFSHAPMPNIMPLCPYALSYSLMLSYAFLIFSYLSYTILLMQNLCWSIFSPIGWVIQFPIWITRRFYLVDQIHRSAQKCINSLLVTRITIAKFALSCPATGCLQEGQTWSCLLTAHGSDDKGVLKASHQLYCWFVQCGIQ